MNEVPSVVGVQEGEVSLSIEEITLSTKVSDSDSPAEAEIVLTPHPDFEMGFEK